MRDSGSPASPDDGGAGQSDDGLLTSRPPDGFALVRTWRLDTPHELSLLRAQLMREVAGDRAGQIPDLEAVPHTMVLVASELATNALRHGIPPTIVRLLRQRDTYLLDVADHDVRTTPHLAGDRPPGQGGFGLQIARRLALEVGWYATATTKHVWAQFPVPHPA